jgi:hypothetical protein
MLFNYEIATKNEFVENKHHRVKGDNIYDR